MFTICSTGLTFNNSTFCPHSVFMCFVWIWEQAAIISLYNINWLVFITETECVYCAVRTETPSISPANVKSLQGHWTANHVYLQHNSQHITHSNHQSTLHSHSPLVAVSQHPLHQHRSHSSRHAPQSQAICSRLRLSASIGCKSRSSLSLSLSSLLPSNNDHFRPAWIPTGIIVEVLNECNAQFDLHGWGMKDQLDVTCYFISLLMCSICFGH